MTVLVLSDKTEKFETGEYRTIELECGKRKAVVMVGPTYVSVVCQNAAHKVWNGPVKSYENLDQAREKYKSSAMKSIIDVAKELQKF
jgi:hypothetical protein